MQYIWRLGDNPPDMDPNDAEGLLVERPPDCVDLDVLAPVLAWTPPPEGTSAKDLRIGMAEFHNLLAPLLARLANSSIAICCSWSSIKSRLSMPRGGWCLRRAAASILSSWHF